jgi:hypothetical protein
LTGGERKERGARGGRRLRKTTPRPKLAQETRRKKKRRMRGRGKVGI